MAVSQQCSHQSFIACHRNRGQATCGSSNLLRWPFPEFSTHFPRFVLEISETCVYTNLTVAPLKSANIWWKILIILQWRTFLKFLEKIPSFKETLCPVKTTDSFLNNEAVTASYVKYALIHQSQTFVALRGLDGDITPNGGLGWEVVSKINKALQLRNYKQSAVEKERKPAKQFVACCIFNSLSAWHKDGCQTTEETSRGMTEKNGKRKRALRWGNFPFRLDTLTHTHVLHTACMACILQKICA